MKKNVMIVGLCASFVALLLVSVVSSGAKVTTTPVTVTNSISSEYFPYFVVIDGQDMITKARCSPIYEAGMEQEETFTYQCMSQNTSGFIEFRATITPFCTTAYTYIEGNGKPYHCTVTCSDDYVGKISCISG